MADPFAKSKELFELARTHESCSNGMSATAVTHQAVQELLSTLEGGNGTSDARASWRRYLEASIAHLKELEPVAKHVFAWRGTLDRAYALAADGERAAGLGEPAVAADRLSGAAWACLKVCKAIEATTGPGSAGAATTTPWAWFSADTRGLFERATGAASRFIERAEKLKARRPPAGASSGTGGTGAFDMSGMAAALPPAGPGPAGAAPSSSPAGRSPGAGPAGPGRALEPAELGVLRRTSRIQGRVFLPWAPADATAHFDGPPKSFVDRDGALELSAPQRARFKAWRRATDLFKRPTVLAGERPSAYSVTQELVGTCSFLSSLCAGAEFERRTGKRIISAAIYPQDAAGRPVLSPSGRYAVRLQLNGVWRCVVIDDFLPADASGRVLCSRSNNEGELWVSLLEKAFLKVVGSYAFAGSTSSKDLHVLTGWLPETWRASRKGFDPTHAWNRLLGGHRCGDVLASLGTSELSKAQEESLGLVSGHAYAVLDVAEVPPAAAPEPLRRAAAARAAASPGGSAGSSAVRVMKIKNPWGRRRFRGRLAFERREVWTPALCSALRVGDADMASAVDNGVFWATWEEVLEYFPDIYLSWQPSLLPHRAVRHGCWPLASPGPRKDNHSFMYCPQYRVQLDGADGAGAGSGRGQVVWMLVTRHVTAIETDKQEAFPTDASGQYVPRGRSAAAAADAGGPAAERAFMALHVFAAEGTIDEAGSHASTAGVAGGVGFSSVHSPAAAAADGDGAGAGAARSGAGVACSSGALAGERVFFPADAKVRGMYSNSPYLLTRVELAPGSGEQLLTLALSQLERTADVDYTLSVFASCPVSLAPVPQTLSQFAPVASGAWGPGTDGGRSSSGRFFENPQFCLEVAAEDDVQLTLNGPSSQSIGMRVFKGADGARVTSFRTEEAFAPKFFGKCFVTCIARALPPGKYTVVVATWDQGVHARFNLIASGSRAAPRLTPL
ncbi:hypothetical protein FNF27_00340 [Cafeteria roenbergensis]|uniref:Calpain catalytic domain-containing protein n=1 Tax=Cafeteria roenbergensis TaxID=33653 RepID=A0A5A8ERT5_CAFRO|nr:hypothetical protein FNF27_00340 [Cafeteria roenbergensis]